MKRIYRTFAPLLAAAVFVGSASGGYNTGDVLNGMDKRETIIVNMNSGVTYIAESTLGMPHTRKAWVCSKRVKLTAPDRTITLITVMPELMAPGINGVNLPTFDYPND